MQTGERDRLHRDAGSDASVPARILTPAASSAFAPPVDAAAGKGVSAPAWAPALACWVLAAVSGAFWAIALWDRTTLAGVSRYWLGTFLVATAALVLWAQWPFSRPTRERGWSEPAGMVPAAAVAGALALAVYASDAVHHAFVYGSLLKGVFVPLVAALCLGAPVWSEAIRTLPAAEKAGVGPRRAALLSLVAALRRHKRLSVCAGLGIAGVAQALSYCAVSTDDSIRYWAVADGLARGAGYPVTTGAAGSESFYLVELPLYPLLLRAAFAVAGHRFLALELPLIAANVALPFVLYALCRRVGAGRPGALWLSLALLCVPFYQSYALGAAQPEPLLAVELSLLLLLTFSVIAPPLAGDRPAAPPGSTWHWAALGLVAAAAVLTRPEGALYVAPLGLALAWQHRRRLLASEGYGLWLAAGTFLLPVGAFSLFLWRRFGIFWPAGWTNVAGPQFIGANLRLVLRQDLPYYARAAGLPGWCGVLLAAAFVALAAVGLVRLCRHWPALWCIPVACALNLLVIFDSPSYLTLDLFSPPTFFRHISVMFPWLLPAFVLVVSQEKKDVGAAHSGEPVATGSGRGFALVRPVVALAALGVLTWELVILGGTAQANQAGRLTVLSSDIYVLATDLLHAQDTLPVLPFTRDAAGIAAVDPGFDYMDFRGRLFDAVRPYDLHVEDAGRAHEIATGVAAVLALGALSLARTKWGGLRPSPLPLGEGGDG